MRRHLQAKHLRVRDRLSLTDERVVEVREVSGSSPPQIEVVFQAKGGQRTETFNADERMYVEI